LTSTKSLITCFISIQWIETGFGSINKLSTFSLLYQQKVSNEDIMSQNSAILVSTRVNIVLKDYKRGENSSNPHLEKVYGSKVVLNTII